MDSFTFSRSYSFDVAAHKHLCCGQYGFHLKNRRPVPIIQCLSFYTHMSELAISLHPASPCIRMCTLDDEQYCLGCGRHLHDIVGWTRMSAAEQRAVCERSAERRARNASAGTNFSQIL